MSLVVSSAEARTQLGYLAIGLITGGDACRDLRIEPGDLILPRENLAGVTLRLGISDAAGIRNDLRRALVGLADDPVGRRIGVAGDAGCFGCHVSLPPIEDRAALIEALRGCAGDDKQVIAARHEARNSPVEIEGRFCVHDGPRSGADRRANDHSQRSFGRVSILMSLAHNLAVDDRNHTPLQMCSSVLDAVRYRLFVALHAIEAVKRGLFGSSVTKPPP